MPPRKRCFYCKTRRKSNTFDERQQIWICAGHCTKSQNLRTVNASLLAKLRAEIEIKILQLNALVSRLLEENRKP
jgi:hypothetical protein